MSLADVLDRAAAGGRLSFDEGVRLYREAPLHALGAAAHARRMAMYPTNDVTYVVDTTINYTNVCNVHCTFCAFFRPEHHAEGYTMSHDKVLERVKYAADQGATQIMIQGGVNPELRIGWFEELFRRVAAEYPDVDIHSLSVSEISGLATIEGMTTRAVLERLKAAGMKSLPGAGAEILVERVRKRISARKIVPDAWIDVMRDAQQLGMPTTATMMFGSIETDDERIAHMKVIRDLQDESEGFTAFIPWYYVPYKTPLRGREATGLEYLRVLAVSRLFLDNVPHLQASWLTPGLKLGQLALFYGCDDMGGTIIEEQVVHDAGGGNEATRAQLEEIIRGAGFTPVIRDTYWNLRNDLALATA
ncbi:cyclic dehypoxanthine futalosine synthase [Vulcanimicrobium alpinum]|uniref:Cyclic dehypoxanthine futalosine synthase n=1 Tax=Vulcanimicrobium alpinum TaxID=3016050 RepID=A0AAN1XV18_UNVUL|nr:cyclic dehypoxanthinyl futalosine synthase [Vulcanimicrobium alpinum]BDE05499.1 cyclic dehypoxanthine futalosine synthase [Vulcanimicrobium alpinum]